jgi:putative IMPACT (imprinted ancient) family translation regulator
LTVERSRFHALLTPLASPDAIDALLKARRKDYRKANHHCWACRLRDAAGALVELSKDDGEVGHPGRVLLELLKKHDLEGALVVSRIFGGVKLGVGGVSRAFRDAGQGAINRMAQGAGPTPRLGSGCPERGREATESKGRAQDSGIWATTERHPPPARPRGR